MNKRILFLALILFTRLSYAQPVKEDILQKLWNAQWITGSGAPIGWRAARWEQSLKEYGVYKFRKSFTLDAKPETFIVHVSGDNRYKLFVNGTEVSQGPARGDLYFWNFETADLAPYLVAGHNVVSALVWNDGRYKPEAQITYLTGFILQGDDPEEAILNTNDSWKVIKDESYQPLPVHVPGYYVAGSGEFVDMNKNVSGWTSPDFDDSGWSKPRLLGPGIPKDAAVDSEGWMLVPSPLPQVEMTRQRLFTTRSAQGVKVPQGFPASKTDVVIPAHSKAAVLLDQGFLTDAYPTLVFSGGHGASITMAYAEALYNVSQQNGRRMLSKGNRNEIEGKIFIGKADSLLSNGGPNQSFTTLWWRTYRYLELRVYTQDEPITINDLYGTYTGYPFVPRASLRTSDAGINKILEIGWRTARLCAFETYMDCPYYEQLQYVGDTRVQAMVTMYNTDDDRLVKNALTLIDHSRIPEGITLSRYPTDLDQQIPTFSLWWIGMLHDYFMYRQDSLFVKDRLPGTREVLSFFQHYQQADGSLKDVPYWIYTDWVDHEGWKSGMAPAGKDGESAVLDLQLIWIYEQAAEMEAKYGLMDFSRLYLKKADQLKQTVMKKYWDAGKGLFADTDEKDLYSQHANSLAILSGVVSGDQATTIAKKLLSDTTLAQASIYFKYYLHQALTKAGLGDDYLGWLGKWRENINMGLTTWAESSDVGTARSDCHAWGSSPNIELYRILLGIDSDAPGFARVKVEPHLGTITNISGAMPHPNGMISVSYKIEKGTLNASVDLPKNTTGTFVWKSKNYPLKSGPNLLKL